MANLASLRSMRWWPLLLLLGVLCGCGGAPKPTLTPTPSAVEVLVARADQARETDDRETEALALREALEKLPADSPRAEALRLRCVEAMVEAGGHVSSLRLWTRLLKEDPKEKVAAQKMQKRTKELVGRQGRELIEQVTLDERAGHLPSALCSALAASELFRLVDAKPKDRKAAEALTQRLKKQLKIE